MSRGERRGRLLHLGLAALAALMGLAAPASAQPPNVRYGEVVPRDVREMYDRGLQYLAAHQTDKGEWAESGSDQGPGVTSLSLLAFLASGEDPNYGIYSNNLRRGLRALVTAQNADTGIIGDSMYHHGFSMLVLAEAYGAVDERTLWAGQKAPRTLGQALELAVRAAVTSQKKNPLGAWRYSPNATDADTSVSGAVLVGLLAARNAGLEVPDEAVDKAVSYFTKMTSDSGEVGYSGLGGFGESTARTSIAALVYALSHRKDLPHFKYTVGNLTKNLEQQTQQWPEYARYYQAQALFQGDLTAWEKWNKLLVRQLKGAQQADGSFRAGQFGPDLSTSMSLLALALNYRLLPIYER